MDIGNNIKEYRKKANLTQEQLATKLGISKYTLAKYEQNKRRPNLNMITKIIDTLDLNFEDLKPSLNDTIVKDSTNNKKIDKIVSNVEKETYLKKWIHNESIENILKEVLENNKEFEQLRDKIKMFSEIKTKEFLDIYNINNINTIEDEYLRLTFRTYNSKFKYTYIEEIIKRVLQIINIEETQLDSLISSKKYIDK
ncbi:TPA: helix-turn-helix transcriptional regulator [Clostridium botulinum]|uniref:helix-turn-helix domain-containing protein n=1 Tax=Clostridium botulinum TaxID=1491 RepID=UPI000D0CB502|nr:helix-turn-helix transcriptional regulator [Clostridium botulinum]PSL96322.1 hypothetical protein C6C12_19250 [Clostridium botulinum]HDK7140038.1 helix-turn-helix transcriptional regulator [Clostridium botulinum]HDK7143626.1 helix-turn-helix transcriptional regulator [Clostridium botulinum]HDK7147272.1 helix-turn-helix transcriptional regulator [Clostridium botulinum]HDK7151014.1 helix-turn-helix transcriptional regulator [Clostridium botulinum]